MKGSAVVSELAKMAEVLRESGTRNSFMEDPKGALERAGVNTAAIPSSVLDTLSGMTDEELGVVVRFNDALVNAGVVIEGPDDEPDGGRVGFF